MKKSSFVLMTTVAALTVAASTLAHAHGHGHYHPRPGYGHGYSDGFLAGLLVSTYSVFTSHITAYHKELVYIGAADEAAAFLAEGSEPSVMLREAFDTERAILTEAGVAEVDNLSDEDLAFLVIGRVNQLK